MNFYSIIKFKYVLKCKKSIEMNKKNSNHFFHIKLGKDGQTSKKVDIFTKTACNGWILNPDEIYAQFILK